MISFPFNSIQSVLCIGAHADDIEIGCGGTLLKLLEQQGGVEVRWVVLSGNEIRQAEASASAARFLQQSANHQVELKGFADAHFPYTEARELKSYFGQLQSHEPPDLIFTHRREDLHQDHRLVAELTWQHFRNHLILEYEIPKYEGDLGTPNVFVPLGNEHCQNKTAILMEEYPSQAVKPWFSEDTFSSLLRIRGIECQSPTGFAEAFYCRKLLLG